MLDATEYTTCSSVETITLRERQCRIRLLLYGGGCAILLFLSCCFFKDPPTTITRTTRTTKWLSSTQEIPHNRTTMNLWNRYDYQHHDNEGDGDDDDDNDRRRLFEFLCPAPDACPDDPKKTKPGKCGCGVSDVDTDGDGTPDCFDQCPYEKTKTAPGVCGCGGVEGDTDRNGLQDCFETCPSNQVPAECTAFLNAGYQCRGCPQKWLTVSRDCGVFTSQKTNYFIQFAFTRTSQFNTTTNAFVPIFWNRTAIQWGTNSSNSRWERISCSSSSPTLAQCPGQTSVYNNKQCDYFGDTYCLKCDPELYCLNRVAFTTPISNPLFFMDNTDVLAWLGGTSCDPSRINFPLPNPL